MDTTYLTTKENQATEIMTMFDNAERELQEITEKHRKLLKEYIAKLKEADNESKIEALKKSLQA
jgi:mRNA-degrading endonuclease RelE of RelBE toxin-antitoxin system